MTVLHSLIKTKRFAIVDGIQRLRWLKNSLKSSGQNVLSSAAAQYSSFQPLWTISVQSQRSSPVKENVPLFGYIKS